MIEPDVTAGPAADITPAFRRSVQAMRHHAGAMQPDRRLTSAQCCCWTAFALVYPAAATGQYREVSREARAVPHNNEEDAWVAVSSELGEALLDAERTFIDVVAYRHSPRFDRDKFVEIYLEAWGRLAKAHRDLTNILLN
jgi:hypothetical protein